MYTMSLQRKFTESHTREFYNEDDEVYRSFWDKDGNCHWGYFPTKQTSFSRSMQELNRKMLGLAGIDQQSRVLDLGCGNGVNALFLHEETGAQVTGVDLSDIRIENAQTLLASSRPPIRKKVSFQQGSATDLSFDNEEFSHVWSQATMYHVHQKRKALSEISRVLEEGGIFVFDDLIKPNDSVSEDAERHIYDRLLFKTNFNIVSYQQELRRHALRVLHAEDLSEHYATSYRKLAGILRAKVERGENNQFHDRYKDLIIAYEKSAELAGKGDIGWAMFVCKKI